MARVMNVQNDVDANQAFFFENIRSDNNETRLAAIHSLRSVAERLGPVQTQNAIFPLLLELTKEVDEDVRTAFLEQLKHFDALLGGEAAFPKFLEIVEIFLASDEQLVRNKAVEVLTETASTLSPEQVSCFVVPFVLRLFENEWFTARLSALVLFPVAYRAHEAKLRAKLLSFVLHLAEDKIMSVRRLFIINVPIILETVSAEVFVENVFTAALDFFNDPLDTIKMSTIESFVDILPQLSLFQTEYSTVISTLRALVQDKSWRVRYTLVIKYPALKAITADSNLALGLLADVDALLDDREPEVRVAAASIISKMFVSADIAHVDAFFTAKMWERIESLTNNSESDVGATIVEQIGQISVFFGEQQYRNNFVPFIEKILRSSNCDVKLKGLSILSCVRPEFSILQSNLVEGLKDMSNNSLWRVRLSLVEHIGAITSSIMVSNNAADWTAWCKEMLQDEANAVREGTVSTVLGLMKRLDQDWITSFVDDRFHFYETCDNYLLRITTIYLLQRICKSTDLQSVRDIIINQFSTFIDDKIANVRLNLVRALGELYEHVNLSQHRSLVVDRLNKISKTDTDPDVIYFCKEALKNYSIS